MAYLLRFGFDTGGPAEVRMGYAELICNDFGLLNSCQIIRRIWNFGKFVIVSVDQIESAKFFK
jgi:hypothetical protein